VKTLTEKRIIILTLLSSNVVGTSGTVEVANSLSAYGPLSLAFAAKNQRS
jgi:hypothetical protein